MMKIPAGAKVVRDQRLTLIHVVKSLSGQRLKDQVKSVKQSLADKKTPYAESDLCLGRRQGGGPVTTPDIRKVFALVGKPHDGHRVALGKKAKCARGALTLRQFLSIATVSKDALKKYLNDEQIEAVCGPPRPGEPALVTELRSGVTLDLEAIENALVGCCLKADALAAA